MLLQFEKSLLYEKALAICQTLKHAGARAYFVGGCVRDACLNKATLDFDIEVFGLKAEQLQEVIAKDYPIDLIGKSFSVIKLKAFNIDISIPRRDSKNGLGHRGFQIESDPFMSIEDSLLRRDFTINAMLYDPLEEQLIDPYFGYHDLQNKTLKHVSDFFADDPLRVLRAMQFIARFDLSVDQETLDLCRKIQPEGLSKERIFHEWKKLILQGEQISKGLAFLASSNWLQYFPELEPIQGCPQEPRWHPEGDVWEHTKLSMNAFAIGRSDEKSELSLLSVGFATLLHDIGKAATTIIKDQSIKSPKHDVVGAKLAELFMLRLTNQKNLIQNVIQLVRYHMIPYQLYEQHSSQAAIKRLMLKINDIDDLLDVVKADHNGRSKNYNKNVLAINWIYQQIKQMKLSGTKPEPLILGRHLIELGLKPSKQFKTILADLLDAQLEGHFETVEQGKAYIKNKLLE